MPRLAKIVLDTTKHHPLHGAWLSLAESLAREYGVELEVKEEDYIFAMEYGDKDDIGMTWLPQLFAVLDDGTVKLILSQYPFDPKTTNPDPGMAYEEAKRRLAEVTGS